jgi:hypothetical protein
MAEEAALGPLVLALRIDHDAAHEVGQHVFESFDCHGLTPVRWV